MRFPLVRVLYSSQSNRFSVRPFVFFAAHLFWSSLVIWIGLFLGAGWDLVIHGQALWLNIRLVKDSKVGLYGVLCALLWMQPGKSILVSKLKQIRRTLFSSCDGYHPGVNWHGRVPLLHCGTLSLPCVLYGAIASNICTVHILWARRNIIPANFLVPFSFPIILATSCSFLLRISPSRCPFCLQSSMMDLLFWLHFYSTAPLWMKFAGERFSICPYQFILGFTETPSLPLLGSKDM